MPFNKKQKEDRRIMFNLYIPVLPYKSRSNETTIIRKRAEHQILHIGTHFISGRLMKEFPVNFWAVWIEMNADHINKSDQSTSNTSTVYCFK